MKTSIIGYIGLGFRRFFNTILNYIILYEQKLLGSTLKPAEDLHSSGLILTAFWINGIPAVARALRSDDSKVWERRPPRRFIWAAISSAS